MWTEAIPTIPDQVQKQLFMLQCRFLIANKPTSDEGLLGIQRCCLQKRQRSRSLALADHNPHNLHDRTPTHARNKTNTSVKSSRCNYMLVIKDITHHHKQQQEWNHNQQSLIINQSKEEYNHSYDAEFSFGGSPAEHVSKNHVKDGKNLSFQILKIVSLLGFGLKGIMEALAA